MVKTMMPGAGDERGWELEAASLQARFLESAATPPSEEVTSYAAQLDARRMANARPVGGGALNLHRTVFGPPITEFPTTLHAELRYGL
jgi:hypothetical protein